MTLHLGVANFDLVLNNVEVDHDEVQLMGLVCLNLAAKVEEDCPPAPELLLPLTGDIYDKSDLARIEKEAISALKWSLRRTTGVVFLHYYSEILGRPGRSMLKMAKAILDLCLTQVKYECCMNRNIFDTKHCRPGMEQCLPVSWPAQSSWPPVILMVRAGLETWSR